MRGILIAVALVAGCDSGGADTIAGIRTEAQRIGVTLRVSHVGKFTKLEGDGSNCEGLERYARTAGSPEDCIMLECRKVMIVSYDGSWHSGDGYYPKCSK